MKSQWSRICLASLLALLASCSGKGKDEVAATGPGDVTGTATGKQVAEVKDLGALLDLIVAEANDLPTEDFDPAALAKSLGRDPQAHFEWVRDHTWWVPYRGLLRGSQGVLLDRLGSSLDRAVLLGDMLRHAGHTVRLAHAQLPERQARELLDKVRPAPEQRRDAPAMAPRSADRKRLIDAVMPGYLASEQERMEAARQLENEARELVSGNAKQLLAATRDMASSSTRAVEQTAVAAIREHWWVERKDGNKWVAMDLLLADATPGDALAAATTVAEWKPGASDPSIPPTEWHTVKVSVIVERYESAAMIESRVLETTLRPASVIDRPITLFHLPKQWPESLADPATDPNALGNAAVNVREWVPILRVGSELIHQSGFTDSGQVIDNAMEPQRDIAETGGGGFMSGFAETLGGGETPESSLTAEWIEYEIHVPGGPLQRIRRPVFDLPGPALRSAMTQDFDANTNERLIARSEALLSQTEIFLQPCELTSEFVSHLTSRSMVANQGKLRELASERDAARARNLALALLDSIDVWGPLPDLARWRSTLTDRPASWFIDRPNILNYRASTPVVNADRAPIKELVDIASNSIGVQQAKRLESFEIRMRQGIVDTVAEVAVLGGGARGVENTASVISRAMAANAGALTRPRGAADVPSLGWPADVAARLAANLDAGYAVFALTQPVQIDGKARTGWWRIDPRTGETIGVMDSGYHAGQAERAAQEAQISAIAGQFRARAIREVRRLERLDRREVARDMVIAFAVTKSIALIAWAAR